MTAVFVTIAIPTVFAYFIGFYVGRDIERGKR